MSPPTALAQKFDGDKTSGTNIGLKWTNPAAPSGLTTAGTIIQWQPAADYALSTASQFAAQVTHPSKNAQNSMVAVSLIASAVTTEQTTTIDVSAAKGPDGSTVYKNTLFNTRART
jgi:hypothetical protein